ncbi:MAG: hypothetical protein JST16_12260 [Bdellovibrionales bacterium]|nr:hypothetical protein [Bdellovibrionales bacterium]
MASVSADTGATLTVYPGGKYDLNFRDPDWAFGGDLGQALERIVVGKGTDAIGSYREISFAADATHQLYAIRLYQSKPIAMFLDQTVVEQPHKLSFPTLTKYPSGLNHLTHNGNFGVASYKDFGADSPWVFFDTQANTFILSAASDYMVASTQRNSSGALVAGVDAKISTLPAGFTHKSLLVVEKGVNRAYETWGRALTDNEGKTRPANDVYPELKYLGYWTDHGAAYYYHYDSKLGYEGTLLAVRDEFKKLGIRPGYMQLDSWWYPKGPLQLWNFLAVFSGYYSLTAAKDLFPQGLDNFQQRLGLPLVTHSKWPDGSSPYRKQYAFSGNMSVDPDFWNDRMTYLHDSGVTTYEQDWLSDKAHTNVNLTDPESFMGNMARAAASKGMMLQYCMPLPRHYLQGAKYNNLVTIRTSNDRFEQSKWREFLFGSRLASALGAWPWADVYLSTETQNLLLSTLSAGMVGVGDEIGSFNRDNLLRAVRPDGVIVKPDMPIVPTDETYVRLADGGKSSSIVAATYTDHGDAMRAAYVFAYSLSGTQSVSFTPASVGIKTNEVYAYDYFAGQGKVVSAGQSYAVSVSGQGSYFVFAPVGTSGIALLGDAGKFTTRGKQRLSQLRDDGSLRTNVEFGEGEESVTLRGWAPRVPTVQATNGSAKITALAKGEFEVKVLPGNSREATLLLIEP